MRNKLIFIGAWPLMALAAYFMGVTVVSSLDGDLAASVSSARKWLIIVAALYCANFAVAWFHRDSWTVNMGRMLAFGLVAYLSMSNLIDLIGENRDIFWDLFSTSKGASPAHLASMRYTMVAWSLCLVMGIVCVGVGFEKRTVTGPGQGDDSKGNGGSGEDDLGSG